MIYNFSYNYLSNRKDAIDYLNQNNFKKVIDIGFSANGWSSKFTTHYVDIKPSENDNIFSFIGNISTYSLWEKILNFVNENGKFDFSICTHTLEDISCPQIVCEMLPRISKEGYIAVPSKYKELIKHEGNHYHKGFINDKGGYNGWVHHRWVFNKEGNDFVAYPKLPLLEYINFNSFYEKNEDELRFFWKDDFDLKVINDDYLGPSADYVRELYKNCLFKE